jgi:hypothetical protein
LGGRRFSGADRGKAARLVCAPPRAGIKAPVRGVSLGALYLIVGVIVAAINDYFDDFDTLRAVGESVIAILIWPLVLFGVDVNLR